MFELMPQQDADILAHGEDPTLRPLTRSDVQGGELVGVLWSKERGFQPHRYRQVWRNDQRRMQRVINLIATEGKGTCN